METILINTEMNCWLNFNTILDPVIQYDWSRPFELFAS